MTDDRLRRVFWALLGLKSALGLALLVSYLASPLALGLSLDEESYFAWAQRILAGKSGGPFFQDPVYPYVLAALLRVTDSSVLAARVFNLCLGVLSLALLEAVVRRLFSPREGLIAMGLWLVMGTVALDELTLAKEPLMMALMLGSAALALAAEGTRRAFALAAGIVAGACVGVRGNFLALLPFVAVLAWVQWPRRLAWLAIAGLAMFPLLLALRNGVQEARWSPTTASSGMVLYIGHHPGADGTWVRAPFAAGNPLEEMPDYVREAARRLGRPVSAAETSRLFAAEGLGFATSHLGEEAGLLWRKIRLTLSWEEVPGNYSRSCVRDRFMSGLWLAPLPGALLWPLALAAVAAQRRRKSVAAIGVGCVVYAATLWMTFVVDRYRLPLWLGCVILAPAGAAAIAGWLKGPRRWPAIAAAVPAMALLAWPVRDSSPERELAQCLALVGATALQAGDTDTARPLLDESWSLDPSSPDVAFNLGLAHEAAGEWPEAERFFDVAARRNPVNAPAWWGLATAAERRGDRAAAQVAFDAFFAHATPQQLARACDSLAGQPGLAWLLPRCRPQ